MDGDLPRSDGKRLLPEPIPLVIATSADWVRSRILILSGGRPSSRAGSLCPIESNIPATSSENDLVAARRGDGRTTSICGVKSSSRALASASSSSCSCAAG